MTVTSIEFFKFQFETAFTAPAKVSESTMPTRLPKRLTIILALFGTVPSVPGMLFARWALINASSSPTPKRNLNSWGVEMNAALFQMHDGIGRLNATRGL